MVYLFTSVEENSGEELQNRKIHVTIEDTLSHKYSVVKNQVANVKNGYDPNINEPTEEMKVCQAMYDIIHKIDVGVAIPYADRIGGFDIDNYRNNDKFFNMIMGFTVSKFMREKKMLMVI